MRARRVGRLKLVTPSIEYLPAYVDALQRGWSPRESRDEARFEELQAIEDDPQAFITGLTDSSSNKAPIVLDDGTSVARLPGFRRWMWDGEFAGSVGLRWDPQTPELPSWCFGHIGYSVVPWKQRRGYATAALRLILPEARNVGLPYVYVTTTPENYASQRVILSNGGVLIDRFDAGARHGSGVGLRYRITLA